MYFHSLILCNRSHLGEQLPAFLHDNAKTQQDMARTTYMKFGIRSDHIAVNLLHELLVQFNLHKISDYKYNRKTRKGWNDKKKGLKGEERHPHDSCTVLRSVESLKN